MTLKIGILAKLEKKFSEFSLQCARYGIECIWLDSAQDLAGQIRTLDLIGILQEQTELWSLTKQKKLHGTPEDFDAVRHTSCLRFYTLKKEPDEQQGDQSLEIFTYTNTTDGTIDLSLATHPRPEDCYHWDDVFVVDHCGLSLYQIKQQTGRKISSRDLNIAQFFKERIHYPKHRDLVHSPLNLKTVVDFDGQRITQTLTNLVEKNSDFIRFPLAVLNRGIFLRSASSRRSFLYWCPGLNAGLPLVPKPKDPMHEKTFMFHDIIHFLMPDLVFDGNTSQRAKICYVAYRIASELISLVVADMLYVAQSKTPYPTVHERRIFPLYQAFGPNPDLEMLLEGAFRYGFFDDDSLWRAMLQKDGYKEDVLENFKTKYDKYILQDFFWTLENWEHMSHYKDAFFRWWRDFGGFTSHLESVTSFIDRYQLEGIEDRDQLLHQIFHIAKEQVFSLLKKPIPSLDIKQGMHKVIGNYLVGQARIFYRYDFLAQTEYYRSHFHAALSKERKRPALDKLRALYKKYLAVLVECRLIDPDDEALYQETYPIFDTTIVDYRERPSIRPLEHLSLETK